IFFNRSHVPIYRIPGYVAVVYNWRFFQTILQTFLRRSRAYDRETTALRLIWLTQGFKDANISSRMQSWQN
ncbi:hypothetical protein L9F63_002447, partial [Diploptera punctata]